MKDTQHAAGLLRGGIPGLPNAKMQELNENPIGSKR